jgi:hypothetical protein
MSNVDDDPAADGPDPNGDTDEMYVSAVPRRSRRKRVVVGAAGLAAILGAGAFVATNMIDNAHPTATGHTSALGTPPSEPDASAGVASPSTSKPSAKTPAKTTSKAKTAAQRVADARAASAKDRIKVLRPLPPKNGGKHVAAKDVKVTTFGSVRKDRSTLRVMSARQDLSGQRELAWVADDGVAVGSAWCSQKFRFSGGTPVAEKPTLLVCWRLSEKKSVYTVAVKIDGRPSKAESVAAINKAWSKL